MAQAPQASARAIDELRFLEYRSCSFQSLLSLAAVNRFCRPKLASLNTYLLMLLVLVVCCSVL